MKRPYRQPAATPSRILDVERALSDIGGDREGYADVLAVFLEEVPKYRAELRACRRGSPQRLLVAAHEIAGSLGVIGARDRAEIVRQLERSLQDGHRLRRGEVVDVIDQCVAGAQSEAVAYLTRPAAADRVDRS